MSDNPLEDVAQAVQDAIEAHQDVAELPFSLTPEHSVRASYQPLLLNFTSQPQQADNEG